MIRLRKMEDEKLVVHLVNLEFHDDHFGPFVERLEDDLRYYRELNDNGEGVILHQQQGVCQYLKNLIHQIRHCKEILNAMRGNG